MTIARLVFEALGVPCVAVVVVIYRAVFLLVWFEIILFSVGGFMYDEDWHGWSPTACFTNFVDGNVVIHGTALKATCDTVAWVALGKQCSNGEDVNPIFHKSGIWTPGRRVIEDAATRQRQEDAAQTAFDERGRCGELYRLTGNTLSAGRKKWLALSSAERSSTTWHDYFRRIEPQLDAERASCKAYCPTGMYCGGVSDSDLKNVEDIAEYNAARARETERMVEHRQRSYDAYARRVDGMEKWEAERGSIAAQLRERFRGAEGLNAARAVLEARYGAGHAVGTEEFLRTKALETIMTEVDSMYNTNVPEAVLMERENQIRQRYNLK